MREHRFQAAAHWAAFAAVVLAVYLFVPIA